MTHSAIPVTVLVVAKAPVPGLAKTRLAATLGDELAADIAAAALLDTLDAVAQTPVSERVVAMTGDLDRACRGAEIRERLGSFTVIGQRGEEFADRLANAHADAAVPGQPVLQIGMDTPQVSAELLTDCARTLLTTPALLGMARRRMVGARGGRPGDRRVPARRADVAGRHRRCNACRSAWHRDQCETRRGTA